MSDRVVNRRASAMTCCTTVWPAVNFDHTMTNVQRSVNCSVNQDGGRFVGTIWFVCRCFWQLNAWRFQSETNSTTKMRRSSESAFVSKSVVSRLVEEVMNRTTRHNTTARRHVKWVGSGLGSCKCEQVLSMNWRALKHFRDTYTLISIFVIIMGTSTARTVQS